MLNASILIANYSTHLFKRFAEPFAILLGLSYLPNSICLVDIKIHSRNPINSRPQITSYTNIVAITENIILIIPTITFPSQKMTRAQQTLNRSTAIKLNHTTYHGNAIVIKPEIKPVITCIAMA